MDQDRMKQNLVDAGCSETLIQEILTLSQSGRHADALQRMKKDRCRLMDELHESGRRVDRLDFLIRQAEKELQAISKQ